MITLTLEDGTGLTNSNTYVSLDEADAYIETRLYSDPWLNATPNEKKAALVQCSRIIDSEWQFHGYKLNQAQAMQWPRAEVPDPDNQANRVPNLGFRTGDFLPEDTIPTFLKNAVCELCVKMLDSNRLADPDGEGLERLSIEGAISMVFKPGDRKRILPREVETLLSKYGHRLSGSGTVKLSRA